MQASIRTCNRTRAVVFALPWDGGPGWYCRWVSGCILPILRYPADDPQTERTPLLLFPTSRPSRAGLPVSAASLLIIIIIIQTPPAIRASMQDAKPGTMARSNCQTGCCGSTPPAADASATTPCTVNAEPEEPTTPKAEKMLGGGCSTGAKEGGSGGKARVSCCSPGAGACASDDNTPVAVEAPASVAGASGSQGGCCASSPEAPPNCQGSQAGPARDDAGGLAKAPSKESCQDGCCGKTQDVPPVAVQPEPPCCEGKQKPCCSDECIDRIALRECEKRCRRASHARARSSTEGLSSSCPAFAACHRTSLTLDRRAGVRFVRLRLPRQNHAQDVRGQAGCHRLYLQGTDRPGPAVLLRDHRGGPGRGRTTREDAGCVPGVPESFPSQERRYRYLYRPRRAIERPQWWPARVL